MSYTREQIEGNIQMLEDSLCDMDAAMLRQLLAENDALQKDKEKAEIMIGIACNREGMLALLEDRARIDWIQSLENGYAFNYLGNGEYEHEGCSPASNARELIDAARAK